MSDEAAMDNSADTDAGATDNNQGAEGENNGEGGENNAAQTWPDDWRTQMAGEDDKQLKRLERFNSPNDLHKSYLAINQKLSSGELRAKLGDEPTEDEVKAYREAEGVPLETSGYFEDMPDGLVIGEDDKALFDSVAEPLHALNASPEIMHSLTKWYYDLQENAEADQVESDKSYHQNMEDELRVEWGGEYRANVNAVNSFLRTSFSDDESDLLLGARLSDGTLLGDNAGVLKAFAAMSRQLNPAATLVPNSGQEAGVAISDEINIIKAKMADKTSEYWKGPKNEAGKTEMEARYRVLLDAKERMEKVG